MPVRRACNRGHQVAHDGEPAMSPYPLTALSEPLRRGRGLFDSSDDPDQVSHRAGDACLSAKTYFRPIFACAMTSFHRSTSVIKKLLASCGLPPIVFEPIISNLP